MKRTYRERKSGYEMRDQTAGHLIDYSDHDVVDNGEVIAELWQVPASNMDMAMCGGYKSGERNKELALEIGCVRIPGSSDECVKIIAGYLSGEQLFNLYEIVRAWMKELNPPTVIVRGGKVTGTKGIVDEEDEKRIEQITSQVTAQVELKKAIVALTDEFSQLQGKVDNVLYIYEGVHVRDAESNKN
jgi:hypothetical protein